MNESLDVGSVFKCNGKLLHCSIIDCLNVLDFIIVQLRRLLDDFLDRCLHIGAGFDESFVVGFLDGVSIRVNFLDVDTFTAFGGCCGTSSDELQIFSLFSDDDFVLLVVDDGFNVICDE